MSLLQRIFTRSPQFAGSPAAVRAWWVWAVFAGIVLVTATALVVSQGRPPSRAMTAVLQVGSVPAGATIEVDGRDRGRAPAILSAEPGEHGVKLRLEGYFDADYRVVVDPDQVTTLEGELWLRSPQAEPLRPAFPGASIADAGFLADGQIALTVVLPPSDERQLWLLDGKGGIRRFGPPEMRGPVAISSDGAQVAYVRQGQSSGIRSGVVEARFDEVWVSKRDGEYGERRYALPPEAHDQGLVDLVWAPDGKHLYVVVYRRLLGGGQRTRLLWLDVARSDARELVTLPSEVIAGSYLWSSDGQIVVFLTRAGQLTSLCLVSTSGEFRYLADLSRDAGFAIPFPPLAWSPDGRQLVYAAPPQDRLNQTGWLFGPKATTALSITDGSGTSAKRREMAEGQSPVWRSDGLIFALVRPKSDKPLVLRAVESDGSARDLGALPVQPAASHAARWDVAHAQALIASASSNTFGPAQREYWLVRFRPEVAQ